MLVPPPPPAPNLSSATAWHGAASIQSEFEKASNSTEAKRRSERLETVLLLLVGLALFSSCAGLAFGTVAAARTASTSVRLPVSGLIPGAHQLQG